jgi:hypothetical protein
MIDLLSLAPLRLAIARVEGSSTLRLTCATVRFEVGDGKRSSLSPKLRISHPFSIVRLKCAPLRT